MSSFRLALASAAALGLGLVSTTAHAGGVGVFGTAGVHEDRAYYYRSDGLQGIDSQLRPNFGFGGEFLLGDKDDRVQGLARAYFLSDAPVNEPDLSNESSEYDYTYPPAHEQGAEQNGLIMVGVQWGLLGDPSGLHLVLNSLGGSAFATPQNLEYVQLELDVGATYTLNERIQPFALASMAARYRKRVVLTENVFIGVRYLFD